MQQNVYTKFNARWVWESCLNASGQGREGFRCCCFESAAVRFVRAPPRPLVEDEDAFLVLLSSGVSIDGAGAPLNAGSIKSSLTKPGDGAACCCFLSSSADISFFGER